MRGIIIHLISHGLYPYAVTASPQGEALAPHIASSRLPVTPGRRSLRYVALTAHLALFRNGVEPPKRALWAMKRGGEMKKQGVSRSASSKRGDYVSEGVGGTAIRI